MVPENIYRNLKINDILSIDFNSVVVQIIKETARYFECRVIQGGTIGSNKSISLNRDIKIPPFTDKDIKAFLIGEKINDKELRTIFYIKSFRCY